MVKGLNSMKCGNCGRDTVHIFTNSEGRVFAECTQCESLTEIAIESPRVEFKYPRGIESKGILADFHDQKGGK